ncbi:MAG: preprotein translocase subunit SecA [Verrucomicrobiales bacterium]|jgi:preprotein translocase subunit SecA
MWLRKRSSGKSGELDVVNRLEPEMTALSDEELQSRIVDWREGLKFRRFALEDIHAEALAAAREIARRATGLFAYDVQVEGAIALLNGHIAELATGEGKTLVAVIASLVLALEGRGVHVATVNSYLAERDYEFAEKVFDFAGMTVGLLPERGDNPGKKAAYACDATYGVGYEFGFDYLRDQLSRMRRPHFGATQQLFERMLDSIPADADVVQRGLAVAIIDEVDSVLIDEAGSPLVISEAGKLDEVDEKPYHYARQIAQALTAPDDFNIRARRPSLTSAGIKRIHEAPDIPWNQLRRPWQAYIVNALMALHVFKRDEQYIVRDDDVIIVDEFTGRAHEERSWNGGLHQAVSAEAGTKLRPEMESAASITRQRYFALYDQISGLTGTANESAPEFKEFFKLSVTGIPLHRPGRRELLPDRVFDTQSEALDAAVNEVNQRHLRRQPVLVGTRTIRVSEAVSERLTKLEIPHRILTAKEDKEENEIVVDAGKPGNVLIATNMAGRGTHISLPDESIAAGGLHVIGIERNESCRIDRQLIGRCARQGQPGSAQFFLSAEDALANLFTEEGRHNPRKLRAAQAKVEKKAYQLRRLATERDQWIDQIRNVLA